MFNSVKEHNTYISNQKRINKNNKEIEQCQKNPKTLKISICKNIRETNESLRIRYRAEGDNLFFSGIPEGRLKDTGQVLQESLQNKYKLEFKLELNESTEWNNGTNLVSTPREIVAFKDIEYNRLNALKRLKGSQIYVYEQFPPEIEVKRRKLYPPLRQQQKKK